MKTTDLTTTAGKDDFYPTPSWLAGKMLSGLDYKMIRSVLEPSAGKGDLVDAIARAHFDWERYRNLEVDICEIDPYLRQICKYSFTEKKNEIYQKVKPIDNMCDCDRTEAQKKELKRLHHESDVISHVELHVVNDNFFTYRTYKHYDLILMNPPFSEGDRHLLRAIEMQERWGGHVICLLNAETIRNPYTSLRVELMRKLNDLEAEIQFVEDAFRDAERKAEVNVAIVRVYIKPPEVMESSIWKRMKAAVDVEQIPDAEIHALVTGDYIEQAIQLYNTEIAATIELVKEYRALCPYMKRKLDAKDSFEERPILTLTVGDDNYIHGFDLNKYLRTVRLKYWHALLSNKKFIGKLTSELQKKYYDNVAKMADYEFSAFNIKQIAIEMNSEMASGVEKAILDLFEKLTVEHSWFPACQQNRHYYNGWATNKAHKIGMKCIIPTYGMFSTYSWDREAFSVSTAYSVISDIEKAFDYLDGGRTDEIDLSMRLQVAHDQGRTRDILCKYFKVDLFKKGTTHIKFLPEAAPLVERLNIYASQKKGWLPPNYGKSTYTNMDTAERAVVDSFHGDGTNGSGADAYESVMKNAAFYLSNPAQKMPALMSAS